MRVLLVLLLVSIPCASLQHKKQPIQANRKAAADRSPSSQPSSAIQQAPAYEPAAYGAYVQNDSNPEPTILGLKRGEFVQSFLAALLILVTAVYAGFTFYMLREVRKQAHWMKRQLAEMKNSRRATVAEMKAAGDQTRDMLTKVDTQVTHLGTLANATRDSADTAKRALELSERADVLLDGISFASAEGNITPHTRPIFYFKNAGRTRAINVKFDFHMTVPGATDGGAGPEIPSITIGSQCKERLAFQTLIESFTRPTFDDIIAGRVKLTFHGKISYEDVFGHLHWASYSGSYDAQNRSFRVDKHETD